MGRRRHVRRTLSSQGTVILKSKDGEEVVEQLWQHLQLDEFTSISLDFEATTVSASTMPKFKVDWGCSQSRQQTATVEFTAPTPDNVVFSVTPCSESACLVNAESWVASPIMTWIWVHWHRGRT